MHMNFQVNSNQRLQYHTFIRTQNYNVGNNILLNRMCSLNNTIPKSMRMERVRVIIACQKCDFSLKHNTWTSSTIKTLGNIATKIQSFNSFRSNARYLKTGCKPVLCLLYQHLNTFLSK